LALVQARRVAELLGPPERSELVVRATRGDRLAAVPLSTIGGQGVFVKEIQEAVRWGEADVAVHSAKDLPPVTPPGLVLGAVPERVDPRDALVGARLTDLAPGAAVATGSARRRAQLANLRPDLAYVELRGNIGTRLGRVHAGEVAAVVVAVAALERLGWDIVAGAEVEILDPMVCLPQVGQGALALECREDDHGARSLLAAIDDPAARAAVTAERALLAALGADCTMPVGAYATAVDGHPGTLRLEALVATGDGRVVVRAHREGTDPAALGADVAAALVADGAAAVMA
jgi:hydroxymethylbilane synthase